MTAGFVLGEVLGLLGFMAVKLLAAMALAFVLALLPCFMAEINFQKHSQKRGRKNRKAAACGHRTKAMVVWIALGFFFLLLGYWRGRQALAWSSRERGLALEGTRQTVCGEVLSIKQGKNGQILTLENCVLSGGQTGTEGSKRLERLQVYLEEDGSFSRPVLGNRIAVEGEMSAFSPARNPGEFDYRGYYRSLKLHYRMFADSWRVQKASVKWERECQYRLSVSIGRILEKIADPKDSGIFQAAILGEKSQLDQEIRDLYQNNGIAHLLAISGLHLSLVSTAVYGTLRRLGAGYGKAGLFGGILLTFYAGMTGASPSVLRALIMALCGFLAAYLGRTYDLPSAWGLAVFLLLWDNPYRLCQAGVQLSFGAVAGIALMAEKKEEKDRNADVPVQERELAERKEEGKNHGPAIGWMQRGQKAGEKLGEMLAYSMGMQTVTLPFVLYHYFQIPLYGIFLNLLVVPLMGIVVASGAAGVLLGSIWLPAGRFAAGSGHVILSLYELLCRLWERLPGSLLLLGRPRLWQIAVYFGVFAAVVAAWDKEKRRYSAMLLAIMPFLLLQLPIRGMQVTFLDVGQGDGICIRTQAVTVLADGGSTDQKELGENRLEPFLKSNGIAKVDYAIVSHGDQDHISGLLYLLEESEIAVRTLVLPRAGAGEEVYERLAQLAWQRGGKVQWMERGDELREGLLKITCRYPRYQKEKLQDRNEHSLVLQVDYGDCHMLLTGDMSGEGERRLMELEQSGHAGEKSAGLEQIQILKLAHHGSRHSTTEEWLDWLKPDWAVVSYGEGNRYGHPGQQVLDALDARKVRTWKTAESGAICLRTDGRRIWWQPWIGEAKAE